MNQLMVSGIKMTSLDIAEVTGKRHADVMRDVRREIEDLGDDFDQRIFALVEYTDRKGEKRPCYEFGKKGAMQLALKYDAKTRYRVIERIEELENREALPTAYKESFEMQLIGVRYAIEILRVDETSKIKMLETAHKQHGVPTNHLPVYVDEEVTRSLSSLLKENGIKTTAAKVNTKLIELGLLEIKERPSSKGGVKEFKSITKEGERFGKNLINPRNPKETQPHYYESTFQELLDVLGICKAEKSA